MKKWGESCIINNEKKVDDNVREFRIQENDANQRVDKFIAKTMKKLPKSLMYKFIRNKKIKVNRKRCEISQRLQEGDIMQCFIPEEFFDDTVDMSFLSVPSSLDIMYEDQHIVIANKPSGLLAHRDVSEAQDTLTDRFLHYLYKKKEFDPNVAQSFRPALCHRIDRNTQGIVIMAKDAQALREMNTHIKAHEVKKYYVCIVEGTLEKKEDILVLWHRKQEQNKVVISAKEKEGFQRIETGYRILHTKGKYSLLEIELKTGKSHQIRAVMAYMGCPLYGDVKYGAKKNHRLDYQALCAYRVLFEFKNSEKGVLDYLNGKSIQLEDKDVLNLYEAL